MAARLWDVDPDFAEARRQSAGSEIHTWARDYVRRCRHAGGTPGRRARGTRDHAYTAWLCCTA